MVEPPSFGLGGGLGGGRVAKAKKKPKKKKKRGFSPWDWGGQTTPRSNGGGQK
jgi:hypothetical protein